MRHKSHTLLAVVFLVLSGASCEPSGSRAPTQRRPRGALASRPMASTVAKGHLGKPFDVKEVTDLDALLAKPRAFEGKKVHVKGVVVQHCHHRRAWFALARSPKARRFLRIWTRHEFLVPAGVRHGVTRAEAEGVVEIQTVPEARARHYAREHGFFGGDPAKISGPQYLPTIKVTGARFEL